MDAPAAIQRPLVPRPSRNDVRRRLSRRPAKTHPVYGTVRCTHPEEELTDHQREVLETAYHSGFFEWPREHTGEEIAETLGISQPAFLQTIRAGERKLAKRLCDRDR